RYLHRYFGKSTRVGWRGRCAGTEKSVEAVDIELLNRIALARQPICALLGFALGNTSEQTISVHYQTAATAFIAALTATTVPIRLFRGRTETTLYETEIGGRVVRGQVDFDFDDECRFLGSRVDGIGGKQPTKKESNHDV
ncbi:MAG: hypothetical protein ACI87A_002420, partial [Planctomycetota bacterium]